MIGALLSTVMLWIMFRPDAAAYLDPFRSEGVRAAVERPNTICTIRTCRRCGVCWMSSASITTVS